ncbi:MAG: CoB--CoM heterodisulfide reductase iron-sulfur subunit A family protein [Candidatus Lokiarchaeota archaeon]|nr:CoB--CoM heterodisulfide reductase iron-sulfur subunit A family protein [Candidatus Lokiarchaeota archaeon]
MDKIGAVLIVGGGIGGTQAALDLSESGFKVYLTEKTSSIGGVMAQLDKTFPTNDCAMCIVSPKLVEAGRHPNIDLIINSEIIDIEGEAGNFFVTLNKKSLFINQNKCTGCGVCAQYCPIEGIDFFNEKLAKSKAVFVKYPQAVPLVYCIDQNICIGCGICSGVCKAGAVEYEQEDKEIKLNVGSVILAPGFDEFDPSILKIYGYGKYKNIVTSIEFERILSASGPYGGRILRPSDGDIPRKIAFLHCVGSRDPAHGKEYCSSVCCMYTAKEAVIAKEHEHLVNPTIFSMDIRAYGKDFDKYIERAKDEYGVRYIRSRISSISEIPDTKNLLLTYESSNGKLIEENYNMVVLAVGLNPPIDSEKIAKIFNIELNEYKFAKTSSFNPVDTSRPGIYVCGVYNSPKDIPETVTEASAAAGRVNELLATARGKLITKKKYPQEIDVRGQPPRIGVFICHCGINIGGFVDVPAVTEYVKSLPDVVLADRNLYTCSADTQDIIKEKIKEFNLNRVIVASCTPRTHEPLFQETIREAGLNRYLFQMTNIRDQCSWVHMHEPKNATEKAIDLVRMAIAKVRNIIPLQRLTLQVIPNALIIGGGISGMVAAINFANQGYQTYLIEKEEKLGGFARNIYNTLEEEDVQTYINSIIKKIEHHPNIITFKKAEIKEIVGYIGNFKTYLIHSDDKKEEVLDHGIIIVATGAHEYIPTEYNYGEDSRIITQLQLEKMLHASNEIKNKKLIVMIQCIGSRNEEHPYCSRICCAEAIKNSLKIKEKSPNTEIIVLFRDIRTYGFKEKYYRKARQKGVIFLQYDPLDYPKLTISSDNLELSIKRNEDIILNIKPDLLVLSTGVIMPFKTNENLAKMLKVPLNEDHFFLEAHVKLRPVDFATEGIFVAGLAHAPKSIRECITQANAAVSRACTILSKDIIEAEGKIALINPLRCSGCGLCVTNCAYNAISIDQETGKAIINSALCKGCGACSGSCRCSAIDILGFTDEQINLMIMERL